MIEQYNTQLPELPKTLSCDQALQLLIDGQKKNQIGISLESDPEGGDSCEAYPHINIRINSNDKEFIQCYRKIVKACFPGSEVTPADSFSQNDLIIKSPKSAISFMSKDPSQWVKNQKAILDKVSKTDEIHYELHKGINKQVENAAETQGYPKVSEKLKYNIGKKICEYTRSEDYNSFVPCDSNPTASSLPSTTTLLKWGVFATTGTAFATMMYRNITKETPDITTSAQIPTFK